MAYALWATPLDADQSTCPRCKGSGTERDMDTGRRIVCRDCSGTGSNEEADGNA